MSAQPIALGFDADDAVIVTGAASGIGAAVARGAASVGLTVIAWDIDPGGLTGVVDAIIAAGGRARGMVVDVGDPEAVTDALRRSVTPVTPRYLVNNAGPPSAGELAFDDGLRIAVGSVRNVTAGWLEHEPPAGAALVNVASVAGNVIATAPDWYPAAKAAIAGYTRHLAAYRSDRVRANAVAPGMVDTPRLADFAASDIGRRALQRIPLRRLATPQEIAWPVLFLLSPLAAYVNGSLLVIDGGWTITQ